MYSLPFNFSYTFKELSAYPFQRIWHKCLIGGMPTAEATTGR